MRGVKGVHTAVCRQLPSVFPCEKRGGLDVQERSELFPQYQTYQLYVRVVVRGVLGHTCLLGIRKTRHLRWCFAH